MSGTSIIAQIFVPLKVFYWPGLIVFFYMDDFGSECCERKFISFTQFLSPSDNLKH